MTKDNLEVKLSVDLDFLLLICGGTIVGLSVFHSDYDFVFFLGLATLLAGIYYLVKYRFIKKKPETAGFEFSYKEEKSNKQG